MCVAERTLQALDTIGPAPPGLGRYPPFGPEFQIAHISLLAGKMCAVDLPRGSASRESKYPRPSIRLARGCESVTRKETAMRVATHVQAGASNMWDPSG